MEQFKKVLFISYLTIGSVIFTPAYGSQGEKTSQDSKSVDLLTGSDTDKLKAIQKIIKEKDSSQVPNLITVLKETQNPTVASEAAIALGIVGKKGEVTTALKQKIESTEDGNVVYACILSLFNLHRKDSKKDPEVEAAVRYALDYRKNDAIVLDLLDKLKPKLLKEQG